MGRVARSKLIWESGQKRVKAYFLHEQPKSTCVHDETSINVKKAWVDLYRVVDSTGKTLDFWLSPARGGEAAKHSFLKMRLSITKGEGVPKMNRR
jgi:IS6 family transposase